MKESAKILIDEHAEQELLTLIEAFKLAPEYATRCIHFQFAHKVEGLREVLIASAQRRLHANNPKIYFCDTGDIVVIAEPLSSKDGNLMILDVVNYVSKPADRSWVIFDELARQLGSLLMRLEPMLQQKRKAQEAARKADEEKRIAMKRQAILNRDLSIHASDIAQRRNQRSIPELMLIEDDTFSRRLVENVLQKHYALTSLADASYAIDTYARIAPDLLFLDINLPDVTGHELLERLISLDPDACVIMLSGNADQGNIMEAMRKGAKGFIAKPFTREKLFQYIDRCDTIIKKQQPISAS